MARTAASARPLTDHDEIRRWAEQRNAKPSCVRRTGGGNDVGMIRLDFPGYSGEGSLEEISWSEWFDKFDESNLALLVQDTTARGQQSNFNRLVSREGDRQRARNGGSARSSVISPGRGGARSTSSRSRAAKTGSRSQGTSSVRGRKSGRTSVRGTSIQRGSARGTSSRNFRSQKDSKTSSRRSSTRGTRSRDLRVVGGRSTGKRGSQSRRGSQSSSSRGRGGNRRAA